MPVSVLGTLQSNLFSPSQNISIRKLLPHVTENRTGAQSGLLACWCQTLMGSLPGSARQPLTPVERGKKKFWGFPWSNSPGLWYRLTWATVRRQGMNIVTSQSLPKYHTITQARASKLKIWARWRKKNHRLALNIFMVSNVLRSSWKSSTNWDCDINMQERN